MIDSYTSETLDVVHHLAPSQTGVNHLATDLTHLLADRTKHYYIIPALLVTSRFSVTGGAANFRGN